MTAPTERTARVFVLLVAEDTGQRVALPIGRVPLLDGRPPCWSAVMNVMRTAIERVEIGRWTRRQFDEITEQLDLPEGPQP